MTTKRTETKSVRAIEALKTMWAKESFGTFLRSIRESDNISQAELARRLDVSRQFLNAIEAERKAVGVELASRIADALGYSEELFLELAIRDQLLRAGKKFTVTLKAG